jgi:hypothetical protein
MLERALLTEFLPTTEKAGVEELLEVSGIEKISPAVRVLQDSHYVNLALTLRVQT